MSKEELKIAEPPRSLGEKIKWLGPGFLWMVSAAGSGELLFTPRIGALYGYSLLWALLVAVILKWFINREIGRYTVCTGKTVIDGFSELPGPRNWALYLILIPQIFVAVASIAGLAGSAATALILVLPYDIRIWTSVAVIASTLLVIRGKFKAVEKVAMILAITLGLASIVAAVTVFPETGKLVSGLAPKVADNVKFEEVLPWLGFMLSGAAGLIWYSYWIKEKGYGLKTSDPDQKLKPNKEQREKLIRWIRQMTLDNSVAVGGTLIITISFLILGTELLQPKGLVPEENKVAEVLGELLAGLWGPIGFWFMIVAVFIGFWDTVLSDQDGFGRMFTGGIRLIFKRRSDRKWLNEKVLRKIIVIGLVTVCPLILYFIMGEPVRLLQIAGAIEASHIPVVVVLVLYLNRKQLSKELQPSTLTFIFTAAAGLFFAVFASIYIFQMVNG
jgi:Mn2+/Fe2+ NRAMP family transporter